MQAGWDISVFWQGGILHALTTRVPGVPDRTGLKSCGPGPDRAGPGPDTGPGPLLVRFLSSFDSKALKKPYVSP